MPHWIKNCCAKDDVCSICQESLTNSGMDNIIYELYCGHQFHTGCLMNYINFIPNKYKSLWKHRKDDDTSILECPTCRTFIELDEITTIKSVPENFLDEDQYDVVTSPSYTGTQREESQNSLGGINIFSPIHD